MLAVFLTCDCDQQFLTSTVTTWWGLQDAPTVVSTAALLKHPGNAAQPRETPALGKYWHEGNNEVRRMNAVRLKA